MVMYVYRDEQRASILYAKDANSDDISTRFYCPTPHCDAHMFICGLNGESSTYFRATLSNYPHINGCTFKNSNTFNPANHDEEAFNFEETLESMMISWASVSRTHASNTHGNGPSQKRPLRTIRQIYDMCKSFSCMDSYNDIVIGTMLLDDRSQFMYPKGIFGFKLIETNIEGMFYSSKSKTITLFAPIKIKNEKVRLQIEVEDDKLFSAVRSKLYNNQDKTLIIAGNWGSTSYNHFGITLTSKKQYHVIQK